MKTLHKLCFFATLILCGVAPIAWAADGEAEREAILSLRGDASRGKVLFAPCEACHRKDASGRSSGAIPRLSGQHARVLVKQIVDIRAGRRNNPAMQPLLLESGFSAADIADIAAYLQGLPITAGSGKGPGKFLPRGKQLYEQDCASCHGARGEGEAARFYPMVAAQQYNYLLRETLAIRDGGRGNSNAQMVELVKTYVQADIEAVADYMAQFPPVAR